MLDNRKLAELPEINNKSVKVRNINIAAFLCAWFLCSCVMIFAVVVPVVFDNCVFVEHR